MDELLFRLNVLSNGLHHTLPAKAHHYRADSPVVSPAPRHLDTKVIPYVFRESLQGMLKKKKKERKEKLLDSRCCLNAVILLQEFEETRFIENQVMSGDTQSIPHALPPSNLLQ